uniref:Uncharacterized protein n=1 Tax=Arundo donax TaxID=35708 RepID=A0A0A9EJV1_ARUDO
MNTSALASTAMSSSATASTTLLAGARATCAFLTSDPDFFILVAAALFSSRAGAVSDRLLA